MRFERLQSIASSVVKGTLASLPPVIRDEAMACTIEFAEIEQAYAGYVFGESTCGQRVVYELGLTGIPVVNVNNNCSTGSSALFLGRQAVEGGLAECVLVIGFEKMEKGALGAKWNDRLNPLDQHAGVMAKLQGFTAAPPAAQMFGGAGREYRWKYGTKRETFAKISEKARKHAANNPFALFNTPLSVEEIMASEEVFDPLTRYQCCPPTCGAAAAILCSDDFARKKGISGAPYIAAQVMNTDYASSFAESMIKMVGYDMAKNAAQKVYEQTGLGPQDVQVVELHDCFTANELLTYEALGLCKEGEAEKFIEEGEKIESKTPVQRPWVFNRPTDVTWSTDGSIFVSDGYNNSRVAKFDKNGTWVKALGERGSEPDQFNKPMILGAPLQEKLDIYTKAMNEDGIRSLFILLEDKQSDCSMYDELEAELKKRGLGVERVVTPTSPKDLFVDHDQHWSAKGPKEIASLQKVYDHYRERLRIYLRHVTNIQVGGRHPTWLGDPAAYAYIRALVQGGRVVTVQGDMHGTVALRSIGAACKALKVPVRIFYTSNAEAFFKYSQAFRDNLASFPIDDKSVMLRTYKHGMPAAAGDTWHYNLHQISDFQERLGLRDYGSIGRIMIDIRGHKSVDPLGVSYMDGSVKRHSALLIEGPKVALARTKGERTPPPFPPLRP